MARLPRKMFVRMSEPLRIGDRSRRVDGQTQTGLCLWLNDCAMTENSGEGRSAQPPNQCDHRKRKPGFHKAIRGNDSAFQREATCEERRDA